MATHSSILALRISWTEEAVGLQTMGSQRVRHDRVTNTFFSFFLQGNLKKIFIYLIVPGLSCSTLTLHCGMQTLSCDMQTLSCNMGDLIPQPEIKSRPSALGA